MSTPIKWRHAPRDHEHDIDDVTGLSERLVTAEDLTAAHEQRLTAVEATVDQIKLANQSAGTGAPTGTAPIGWVYTDIATGDIYRMEASGWVNITAPSDTGTLDITALATGMTAGTWTLRRSGVWVFMNIYDARFTPTSGSTWSSPGGMIPVGFRPVAVPPYVNFSSSARVQATPPTSLSFSTYGGRVSRYGVVDLYDVGVQRFAATAAWMTDDAWPSTLPGSAA